MSLNTVLVILGVLLLAGCSRAPSSSPESAAPVQPQAVTIGGEPVVTLERQRSPSANSPEFLSVQVLPGRGMNVFQVRAFVPGKGDINLIASPPLEEAAKTLNDGPADFYDLKSATMGGAILVPYPNRIRGKLSADGTSIVTQVNGKTISLPANLQAKHPGAEKVAIHGLILDAKFQDVNVTKGNDESSVSATLHGGNFDGHWFSKTDVNVTTSLAANAVELDVQVKNVGDEPLPASVGWHPYFAFLSGDRQQGRLHIPAKRRALVNNYEDVFPTGKTAAVAGTPYDFTAPKGASLGTQFLDDSFVDLERQPDGSVIAEIADPKANYGLRVTALSKEIRAMQAYSPSEKNFLALEPQFNYVDPYGKEWGKTDTGMVVLKPGESVTYRVRLELFIPN
jgi:galactose mutarotase-like enzyme